MLWVKNRPILKMGWKEGKANEAQKGREAVKS